MPASFNAAIAYANLADGASIVASSAVPLAPAIRLRDPHVARKWRGANGSGESLIWDFGAPVSLDTVALMGLSLSAVGTVRVRASATDASGQAGELHDSNVLASAVDPRFDQLVYLLPNPVSARYVRVDLTDAGAAFIEAGRHFIGLRYQFPYNYGPGGSFGFVDPSEKSKSRGGQTYVTPKTPYRTWSISFEAIPESFRQAVVDEIDRVNGARTDLLFILRADSPNLGRDAIWGLVVDLDSVGQPQLAWVGDQPLYAKSYRIEERL